MINLLSQVTCEGIGISLTPSQALLTTRGRIFIWSSSLQRSYEGARRVSSAYQNLALPPTKTPAYGKPTKACLTDHCQKGMEGHNADAAPGTLHCSRDPVPMRSFFPILLSCNELFLSLFFFDISIQPFFLFFFLLGSCFNLNLIVSY